MICMVKVLIILPYNRVMVNEVSCKSGKSGVNSLIKLSKWMTYDNVLQNKVSITSLLYLHISSTKKKVFLLILNRNSLNNINSYK